MDGQAYLVLRCLHCFGKLIQGMRNIVHEALLCKIELKLGIKPAHFILTLMQIGIFKRKLHTQVIIVLTTELKVIDASLF